MNLDKLKKIVSALSFTGRRAQGSVMTLVVGVILVVAVAIPVTQDIVDNSTATGTTATILDLLVLFLAIGVLVLIARGSGIMS